ncbi:PH domain-containing protein [Cellulomonas sp. 179-A 9B4 NHS]|uniref:PH domain-containing protein n=1 Tax=Cellulomonas sp. 179-A 9B4 NHS TaxID=3142379 RepID=UPI0039A12799
MSASAPGAQVVDAAVPHGTTVGDAVTQVDVDADGTAAGATSVPATDGTGAPASQPFAAAPEQQVYDVPMPRLVRSILRSTSPWVFVVVVVAAVVAVVVTGDVGPLFVVVPGALGVGGYVWGRLNVAATFRAATSPDGIRLRHGLTETRTQTVPPGRVQAVRLTQGPLWRRPDWWRVEMNVAGYGAEAANESVLHPVATRQEAAVALWLVLPDLGTDDPLGALDAAFDGQGDAGGFTPAPERARWLDPLGWRRHGVLVTRTALVMRSGRWWRTVVVVPHERTQSLAVTQGPVQRRLGVATFVAHSTPGPVTPQVAHLDGAVAGALLGEQAERARQARAVAGPELWMRAAEAPHAPASLGVGDPAAGRVPPPDAPDAPGDVR